MILYKLQRNFLTFSYFSLNVNVLKIKYAPSRLNLTLKNIYTNSSIEYIITGK